MIAKVFPLTLLLLTGASSTFADEWHPPMVGPGPGPAEQIGETVGPYIAGGLLGAESRRTYCDGVAGAAGVHIVGDIGEAAGAGYGRYVEQTGNNPLMPSPVPGHSPRAGKSILDSVSEAFDKQNQ